MKLYKYDGNIIVYEKEHQFTLLGKTYIGYVILNNPWKEISKEQDDAQGRHFPVSYP